jgi:hypothetical protein
MGQLLLTKRAGLARQAFKARTLPPRRAELTESPKWPFGANTELSREERRMQLSIRRFEDVDLRLPGLRHRLERPDACGAGG